MKILVDEIVYNESDRIRNARLATNRTLTARVEAIEREQVEMKRDIEKLKRVTGLNDES